MNQWGEVETVAVWHLGAQPWVLSHPVLLSSLCSRATLVTP